MRCCAIWQSCMSIQWTTGGNVRRSSSNTTHEMILLCSSLRVLGHRFLCVWSWVLPPLQPLENWAPPTYGLKHAAACHSTANFSLGPLVPAHSHIFPQLQAPIHLISYTRKHLTPLSGPQCNVACSCRSCAEASSHAGGTIVGPHRPCTMRHILCSHFDGAHCHHPQA